MEKNLYQRATIYFCEISYYVMKRMKTFEKPSASQLSHTTFQ